MIPRIHNEMLFPEDCDKKLNNVCVKHFYSQPQYLD